MTDKHHCFKSGKSQNLRVAKFTATFVQIQLPLPSVTDTRRGFVGVRLFPECMPLLYLYLFFIFVLYIYIYTYIYIYRYIYLYIFIIFIFILIFVILIPFVVFSFLFSIFFLIL